MEYSNGNEIINRTATILYMVLFFILHSSLCMSQGFEVVKVEESISGTDAFHAPIGKNGVPCGLVKVKSTISDLSFSGQIVGNIENETNEYNIYMERGATHLVISRPNVLPAMINFPDFGIDSVVSKATYNVQVKNIKLNPKTNTVSIDVKPRFAKVYIDNMPISTEISDDGHYQILLPKGSHVCRFEAVGYVPYVQGINVGKDNQNLFVELESQLSDLDVYSQTPLASIYINDSLMGKGSWKGKLTAGSYKIEIKKEGYVSHSQCIILDKNDTRSIVVPELSRKKVKTMIETAPIPFCSAYIDGFRIQKFPIDIEVGEHQLLLQSYGCDTIRRNISIVEGKENKFVYYFTFKNKFYEKAYLGDMEILMALAESKLDFAKNDLDIQEGKFWLSMILSNSDKLSVSFLSQDFLDKYNQIETYDQEIEMKEAIGEFSHIGYKNYKVLFYLFERIKDYDNACRIVEKCGNLQSDFDGGFCALIGDAYFEINRDNDAVTWYRKCVSSDAYDHVKERAQKSIEKIEEKKRNNM